jgi:4-amino-4-deoxy-L-arabinose transferase-like glycosyltransferase
MKTRWVLVFSLLLGIMLRSFFISQFPYIEYDGAVYQRLANNLAEVHTYTLDQISPTMSRVPGYSTFLYAVFQLLGKDNLVAVRYIQMVFDIGTCFVVYFISKELFPSKPKLHLLAFLFTALNPFLANYTAAILTETITIFFLTLATLFFIKHLTRHQPNQLLLNGFFLGVSSLFRPDSAILFLTFVLFLLLTSFRQPILVVKNTLLITSTFVLVLLPWTIRNYQSFGVIQPLAPFSATDPGGGQSIINYEKWPKSWVGNFEQMAKYSWTVPGEPVDIDNLPLKYAEYTSSVGDAYDLYQEYADNDNDVSESLGKKFAIHAKEYRQSHPVDVYIVTPLKRIYTMWFRPRTEILGIGGDEVPFEYSPQTIMFTINLIYIVLAGLGAHILFRRHSKFFILILLIILTRTLFLAFTIYPEPRYLLSLFPLVSLLSSFIIYKHA